MDGLVIRAAHVEDVPRLSQMRRDFTKEDEGTASNFRPDFDLDFARVVRTGIESGNWIIGVAENDGRIVSHAYLGLMEKIPRPTRGFRHIGYLTNVYTSPAFRNRGVGGRVVAWIQEQAEINGVELLMVWPSDQSVGFYERLGFSMPTEPLIWHSALNSYGESFTESS